MPSILYVFPHPDDESFGPAPALARQVREGHAVHVLTLTQGEATRERHKHGYSKAEMGPVRAAEMEDVAEVLGLASLDVRTFPDGGLDDLDPTTLEAAIRARIEAVEPAVVVTYAVHGISGHPDHLVAHAVVKRAFCAVRAAGVPYLRRLAFFTLDDAAATDDRPAHLRGSPAEAIDAVVPFTDADLARAQDALACYRTYQDVVERHRPLDQVADGVAFACFGETHNPRLTNLFAALP